MLKKLKIKLAAAAASKLGDIPVVLVEGNIITQYNDADRQVKDGEALMKDLRGEILEIGRDGEIFRHNVENPRHPIGTVKLQDEDGESLRVQFTSKYGQVADVGAAEALFASGKVGGVNLNINEYMQETVVGKFDCSVFNGPGGKFSQVVYNAFRAAIEQVSNDLGVPCPLETKKVVVPLPSLATERWSLFPTVELQRALSEICPNTTQIVPVRPE